MSRAIILATVALVTAATARADEQVIAPGTADQAAVVVNTGPDGICNTTAAAGDIQAATVGSGTPFRTEIRCGTDRIAQTAADPNSDDTQLVAVGATCKNANTPIVDTGADGIAGTTADPNSDDTQVIAVGTAPANTPCVITGADGVANTGVVSGDDNLVLTPVGTADPNTAVILCGPNLVVDTTANNDPHTGSGDDHQLVPVGAACTANQVVVDAGPDGIADTRAEGPDLVLQVPKPIKLKIGSGKPFAQKTVKIGVSNVEFGASAPASRTYRLSVTKGSCPGGTINQIDADLSTPTLDATAAVPRGKKIKAGFAVKVALQDVTTADKKAPFRCTINVDAIATDTDPAVDDGANAENNSATVEVDVTDSNDQ
jgi:hypothetical protein